MSIAVGFKLTERDKNFLASRPGLHPEFLLDPHGALQRRRPLFRAYVDLFLNGLGSYKVTYASQSYMAEQTGYCLKEINQIAAEADRLGVVTKHRRANGKTNLYKLSRDFVRAWKAYPLKKWLSNLWKFTKKAPSEKPLSEPNVIGSIYISKVYSPRRSFSYIRPYLDKLTVDCKRDTMSDSQNPIREFIRNISCMNLTKWGQIKFMAFTDEALQYGIDKLLTASAQISDRFGFVFSKAFQYHQAQNLPTDFETTDRLKSQYNCPDNAPMLLENQPLLKPRVYRTRTDSDGQYTPGSCKGNTHALYQEQERQRVAELAARTKLTTHVDLIAAFSRLLDGLRTEKQRTFYRITLKNDLSYLKLTAEYKAACIEYGQEQTDVLLEQALFSPEISIPVPLAGLQSGTRSIQTPQMSPAVNWNFKYLEKFSQETNQVTLDMNTLAYRSNLNNSTLSRLKDSA